MKTIRELRNEGTMSTRTYNALVRGIAFDSKFSVKRKFGFITEIDRVNANELTVKDIFELWTEDEIAKWRGLGGKCFEELKGLI